MKISKLFHWLYGFLMLLPVFAVGVKCGYVMFNKNAFESYRGSYSFDSSTTIGSYYLAENITPLSYSANNTTNYYFEDGYFLNSFNYVVDNNNLSNQNAYLFNYSHININGNEFDNGCIVLERYDASYLIVQTFNVIFNTNYSVSRPSAYSYYSVFDNNNNQVTFSGRYIISNSTSIHIQYDAYDDYFYLASNNDMSKVYSYLDKYPYYLFLVDDTLSSVFYSSIQELDKVEFFSWAKDSFLAEPFMYIGNLFGVPNVHPIFTFLSYWMAISIIWLVFDLFMYVPLLVHRWLDKGIVE